MLNTLVIAALLAGALAWTFAPLLRRELAQETTGPRREPDREEAGAGREPADSPPLRAVRGGRGPRGGAAGAALLAVWLAAAAAPGARAQGMGGGELPAGHPPVSGDMAAGLTAADTTAVATVVKVVLRNGTTGGPGQADEVTLQAVGSTGLMQLASVRGARADVDLGRQEIVPAAIYVVEARAGRNQPSRLVRGQDLLAGPVELAVYDGTTDTGNLLVANVNLVVRRLGDRLEVSWLMTLENGTQPPRAIVPGDRPAFAVRVPGGPGAVTRMQASTGMMPTPVSPVAGGGPDWVGLDRALQPGSTRLDLSASLPYAGALELPLEASVDIAQLTIYAFPTDLKLTGAGLSAQGVEPQTGFLILRAPEIPRGAPLRLAVAGGDPEAARRSPHGGMSGAEAEAGDAGTPTVVEQGPRLVNTAIYVAAAIVAVLVVVLVVRRRTGSDAG
ncbi:MAG: hypothetical protein ACYDIE_12320 [Candidatus Krumholzibacteriia bacterium]